MYISITEGSFGQASYAICGLNTGDLKTIESIHKSSISGFNSFVVFLNIK